MLSSNIFYSGYNVFFSILSLFIGISSVFLIYNSRNFRSMLMFQLGGLAMILLTYITTQDHFLYTIGLNFRFVAFTQIVTAIVISVLWIIAATDLYNHQLPNREILTIYTTLAITICFYCTFSEYNVAYIAVLRQMFPLLGIILLFIVSLLKLLKRPTIGYLLFSLALMMLGGKLVISTFFYEYNWLNLNLFHWLWIYIFAVSVIFMRFGIYKKELEHTWEDLDKLNLQIMKMIEASPFPVMIVRQSDKKFLMLNDRAVALFGLSRKETGYHQLDDIMIDKHNNEKFWHLFNQENKIDNFDVMVCNLISSAPFWMSVSVQTVEYNKEPALYMTFQDIAYRKEREANLQNQANKDPLTRIWNRHYFEKVVPERITETIQNGSEFSLLLLDADKFKKINETYGHKVGDKVLLKMAEICRSSLREDDIVARFGGEEFVIFLNDADMRAAEHVAERLRQNICAAAVKNDEDEDIKFTVSIGVVSSEKTASLEVLLRQVDEAMYQAKRGGRNQVKIYDEQLAKRYQNRRIKISSKRNIHPVFAGEENEEISLLGNYDNKFLQEQK